MKILGYFRAFKYLQQVRFMYFLNIHSTKIVKVVIGSGTTTFKGWIATDYPFFDARSKNQWRYLFAIRKADNLLAEHVFEHLTESDIRLSLQNAYEHMSPGGCLRIAVPDKNHPDQDYIDYVRPGGVGAGADDHKSFWDYKSFSQFASSCGFKIELQEYYDQDGYFHSNVMAPERGYISRTRSNSHKRSLLKNYSSLIIDLVKPN